MLRSVEIDPGVVDTSVAISFVRDCRMRFVFISSELMVCMSSAQVANGRPI